MTQNKFFSAERSVILCIEDEQELLRDLVDELTEAGYEAVGVTNGKQALKWLETERPDLILCDISMPVLTGYDILETVRSRDADYANVPFIFLTALANPREVIEGKRLGADDYLVKPIDYDLLLVTIHARLRQVARIQAYNKPSNQTDANSLMASFGLTPTEARVACALTEGKQPAQIAEDYNISRTTVAFHMRNIFQKTETNRQAELVSYLLRR